MIAHTGLAAILAPAAFDDGVYLAPMPPTAQQAEHELRARVAAQYYDDYLGAIAQSHSIPVMDREVDRFLGAMPLGAAILDVGGCWGWHWRRLASVRPDVGVLIIDFERGNLSHARRLLGPLVGSQVALMHADATALPFPDGDPQTGFDGVWSVQVLQHIPDFETACQEAHRVLRPGGLFANYSLHRTPFVRAVYRMFGRPYHSEGTVEGVYHLTRASDAQQQLIASCFGGARSRYTECLFHPDLKLTFSGRDDSTIGRLDAWLSDAPVLSRWVARQRSTEARKI